MNALFRIVVLLLASGMPGIATALPSVPEEIDGTSTSRPLPPHYHIFESGSVILRLCYNWSCATRETVYFTAEEMAEVAQEMAACAGGSLHERLQRLRIGIWKMEELAEKHQPLLANDQAVNDRDAELAGRTDCVDNSSNTTTYLHILLDAGQIPGWSVASPKVRDLFLGVLVHWTAVVADRKNGELWSVDSWYRPNGHLPFVMPLSDWVEKRRGWESPLNAYNPYPGYSNELCGS